MSNNIFFSIGIDVKASKVDWTSCEQNVNTDQKLKKCYVFNHMRSCVMELIL